MKIYLANSIKKLVSKQDIIPLDKEQCLKNESYYFQVYIENSEMGEFPLQIQSSLEIIPYEVVWKKGNYALNKKTDDWYIQTPDDNLQVMREQRLSLFLAIFPAFISLSR